MPTSLLLFEPPTYSAPAPCQKSNHHHRPPHFPQNLAGIDPDEAIVVVAQSLLVQKNSMHLVEVIAVVVVVVVVVDLVVVVVGVAVAVAVVAVAVVAVAVVAVAVAVAAVAVVVQS